MKEIGGEVRETRGVAPARQQQKQAPAPAPRPELGLSFKDVMAAFAIASEGPTNDAERPWRL